MEAAGVEDLEVVDVEEASEVVGDVGSEVCPFSMT